MPTISEMQMKRKWLSEKAAWESNGVRKAKFTLEQEHSEFWEETEDFVEME